MPKNKNQALLPDERIINKIYFIRGKKVMFDRDLAELYEVETRTLNQAVKRNLKRFPDDFMFQLNKREAGAFSKFQNEISNNDASSRSQFATLKENSKSQIVTSKNARSSRSQFVILKRGQNIKYFPFVFTEQGVAMLSSVLKSERAIAVNIQIIRTFTKLREMLSTHKELREKIEDLERKQNKNFKLIFEIIARLIKEDAMPKGRIGFK